MAPFVALECPRVVFRTIFRKEWIRSDGSFKWQAFKPYRSDTLGVSTFIDLEGIKEHATQPFFGIASVKVGRVRDCSNDASILDVVQDTSWHANITGIPFPYIPDNLEDPTLAEKMRDFCTAITENAARPHDS
jgi:hypothetical protein